MEMFSSSAAPSTLLRDDCRRRTGTSEVSREAGRSSENDVLVPGRCLAHLALLASDEPREERVALVQRAGFGRAA